MQALDFVNGYSHALEQVAETLESFHEPLGRISWALEHQSKTLERSVNYPLVFGRLTDKR